MSAAPAKTAIQTAIDVVDYGGGNLGSALRCLSRLDVQYELCGEKNPPSGDRPLLFPGVGAFGAAMNNLHSNGLTERVRDVVKSGTPYLGICIGLQVLFEQSEESPDVRGLGLLPGKVVKFTQGKVPQIGWNRIEALQPGWEDGYVYFVNSYYPEPEQASDALYRAEYYHSFTAAVHRDNITAFQFHPEKSGPFGQSLIERWLHDL
jgi:imidazole glycerol-phosphate synthase subunit HisH